MSGLFKPVRHGGAAITLDQVEASILRSFAVQMLELIGPGDEAADSDDPLARLFATGPSKAPDDPALARLFPDAYGDGPDAAEGSEDLRTAEYSAEFRRFTENDLRARKREDGLALVRSLDQAPTGRRGRVELTLDDEGCRHWLGALNDLRLTLGSRLQVTGDHDADPYVLADEDPRKPLLMAFVWLGQLQESLLDALTR
ncbi:DUF2017 domain-containing protein [Streptacidiphilus sp. PB12-B1b]|uniref:DUF2017 domain-containing protein n=1 Tax=Streptacidiphilus sp. PB12-B1b TaxID=2705012 RepID=UPI0015F96255|nr:DUF2017 domain-containing protein [Streptacidiphilus sp. PB12-B1b]QMU75364.1 DUF2017 domain-containing protein [Streptacidiphilus sp. PB12-B1b]